MNFIFMIHNVLAYTIAEQDSLSSRSHREKAFLTTATNRPAYGFEILPQDVHQPVVIATTEKSGTTLETMRTNENGESVEKQTNRLDNNERYVEETAETQGVKGEERDNEEQEEVGPEEEVGKNLTAVSSEEWQEYNTTGKVEEEKVVPVPTPEDRVVVALLDPDKQIVNDTTEEIPSIGPTESGVIVLGPTHPSKYYSPHPLAPPFGSTKKEEIDEKRLIHALQIKNSADGTEERLYRSLLDPSRYEKDIRPTTHHSLPTNVTFGFLLNQIVEMDERNQVLTTRSWLNINWMDQRLVWNHTEWAGIKTIYIPHHKLWKPDIILVNNAIREYHASLVSTDIMASSDGNVTWLFSALFRSSCPIRVRYYPFDDQECDLKFASWSHDISEMDLGLNTDKGDLSSYMNNSEFDLMDMLAIREVVKFPSNAAAQWPTIVIRIQMHRRPLFYVFNHIIPCVLISSMAVLGFLMPPETGEKINMIITTLLSMGVYLQSINESIPPTSEAVPLIGMYYVSSLFMVCLATCVNVITLNMHRNGAANQGRHVPIWMEKYILGYLASLMRITIREPDSIALLKTAQSKKSTLRRSSILRDLKRVKNMENKRGGRAERAECECMHSTESPLCPDLPLMPLINSSAVNGAVKRENHSETAFIGRLVAEQIMPRMSSSRPLMLNEFENRFRRILKRIYRSLQQHEIREEILDERQRIQWQWQQLASVVDRLLLIMFSLATLLTITFFLILPVGFRTEGIGII